MNDLYWHMEPIPPREHGMIGFGTFGELSDIMDQAIRWSAYIGRRVKIRFEGRL